MKPVFIVLAGLGAFGGLLLLGAATGWFGLVAGRPMAKYATETSAQVYDTSRQYQQGINRDVARYCRQWREAEGPGKQAVAELIRSTVDTYQGPLSAPNQSCINEVN